MFCRLDFSQFTTGKQSFMQENSVLEPAAELFMVLTGFITVRQGLYGSLDTIMYDDV